MSWWIINAGNKTCLNDGMRHFSAVLIHGDKAGVFLTKGRQQYCVRDIRKERNTLISAHSDRIRSLAVRKKGGKKLLNRLLMC